MKKRYYVKPIKHLGSIVSPTTPFHTWGVMDRKGDRLHSEYSQRAYARVEAARLNTHPEKES